MNQYEQQIIEQSGIEISQYQVLSGTTDDHVYLVNGQYVAKFIEDADVISDWYTANPQWSPKVYCTGLNYIIYRYEQSLGKLRLDQLEDFMINYSPQHYGENYDWVMDNLENQFTENCRLLNYDCTLPKRPKVDAVCKLHGDMGAHNLICNHRMVLIDPEPRIGNRLIDIFSMYFSSPQIAMMISYSKLKQLIGCNQDEFDYYYLNGLIDRIMRATYHHPQDLSFYHHLLSQLKK